MSIYRVSDLTSQELTSNEYDVAIVASGYEERCTFLSEHVTPLRVRKAILLGFVDLSETEQRKANDRCLTDRWRMDPIPTSSEDESRVYDILRELPAKGGKASHILVDYSSMSRLWYAGILNWARYGNGPQEIVLDFAYSVGKYEERSQPMIIHDMLAIPGCEGGALRSERSVAVFGLGFYGWASLCVLERLEADTVYAYLAAPPAFHTYPARVRKENKDFLEEPRVHKEVLEFPLRSVETSYRYLSELITPYRERDDITLVPMGPKPHVLASMLLSMRFPGVACLRISAERARPEKVEATGEIVGTRVVVRK